MSAFAFLTKMSIHEAGHVGDALTNAVVGFDPVTASEVDIDNQEKHCHDLALRMAEAEQTEAHDHQTMDALGKTLADTKLVAHTIADQLKATQDAAQVTVLNGKLVTLVGQIKTIGGNEGDGSVSGTYFNAVQNHARSEQKMHEWQQTHAGAMANLTSARTNLANAQTALRDAHDQEVRANEERAQALRDAGLKNGSGSQNVALDAMTKMAEDAQKRARAAVIDTESVKASVGTNADDIIKETLAAATPVSALDMLAQFK